MENTAKELKYYNSPSTYSSIKIFSYRLCNGYYSLADISRLIYMILLKNVHFRRTFRWDEKFNYSGLAIFVARHNTVDLGLLDEMCNLIKYYGFKIIEIKNLNHEERERLISETSLRKWKGTEMGRGYPEVSIAAYDPNPIYLYHNRYKRWLRFYPYLDNLRLMFKHSIRYKMVSKLPEHQNLCLVHATDNSEEAWKYIKITMPEKIDSIKKYINRS